VELVGGEEVAVRLLCRGAAVRGAVGPFYRRQEAVRGGDIFSGEVAGELGRLRDGSAGQLEQGFGRGLDPSCRRGAGFAGRWWNGRLGRGLMAARRVGRR
jgi:hypothetical protein